jgi:hypothetical protein
LSLFDSSQFGRFAIGLRKPFHFMRTAIRAPGGRANADAASDLGASNVGKLAKSTARNRQSRRGTDEEHPSARKFSALNQI